MALEEEIEAVKSAQKNLQSKELILTEKAVRAIHRELLKINKRKKVKIERFDVYWKNSNLEMYILKPVCSSNNGNAAYLKQAYALNFEYLMKKYHLKKIRCMVLNNHNYEYEDLIEA